MADRGPHGVTRILVGQTRVGVVGLPDALRRVEQSGLGDREEILDRLVEDVRARNYVPEAVIEDYRRSLWRELLRWRGEDIRHLFTPLAVVVRGEPGRDRDDLLAALAAILAKHELRPEVADGPPEGDGPHPRLYIDGELVAAGRTGRHVLEREVRRRLSDW